MPPPDEAASDAYLGNGYFPTWCIDVVHRQLERAARDPRYAYGETILTVWPPPANFAGLNAVTRVIYVDDNGDGRADRTVTVPMPIFHVLGLLSELGDDYWVLPARIVGGHVVSGFASRDQSGVVRILLYSHHAQDTQSRSEASFDVTLTLDGLAGTRPARVVEYRLDRDHNSPFRLARTLRDRPSLHGVFAPAVYTRREVEQIQKLCESRRRAPAISTRDAEGRIHLTAHLAGNGCIFLMIGRAGAGRTE